jgi:LPS-assembly protein
MNSVRQLLPPANGKLPQLAKSSTLPKSSKLNVVDGLDKVSSARRNRPSPLSRLLVSTFITIVSITTILAITNQQHLAAQQVASQAPPASSDTKLPVAAQISIDDNSLPLTIEADQSSRYTNLDRLEGNVIIVYKGHTVRADRVLYDAVTGELTLDGHVDLTGGDNDEHIQASHGTYNLNSQTGKFYDVTGSVGMKTSGRPYEYSSPNPFLFSGRVVVKTGQENYDIYNGKVTSCLLPNPDWQLFAYHFSLDGDKARARNSTFRVLNVPVLFLPYVTHPTDASQRQSGILTPDFDAHSSTKGTVIGEKVYIVLGRSADLTLGLQYFSLRGFAESGTVRYIGPNADFFTAHFTALQDRGIVISNILTDQGGQDVTAAFRHSFTPTTRVVGDAEYLSSYIYREAFTDNFGQAVSSDITSVLYAVHQQYGFSTDIRTDRYQGLKRVPIPTVDANGVATTTPGEQVRIFHAPSIDFTGIDHHIGTTPLLWSVDSSVAGLKRSQPNFVSSGIIERLDLRPELSLPLSGGGWHTLSSVAVRETFYSRSRSTPYGPNAAPHELTDPINRNSLEIKVDVRPPAIERTFTTPKALVKFFGPELRHTVEPEFVYRDVRGIGNFLGVLRFDDVDVDSNTNELEYGVTQHVFGRRVKTKPDPCLVKRAAADLPNAPSAQAAADTSSDLADVAEPEDESGGIDANGIPVPDEAGPPMRTHARAGCEPARQPQQEWFSWRLAQRRFFDSNFGGAVINTRRNIFDTTLSLSGIAFLTEPRDISPLISRLRVRTSSHTDIEWDFDLDTGAKKYNSNNIFLDAREGKVFGGVSYARLNAPGRFFTETINPTDSTLTPNAVSDFSQMRLLLGYGDASKAGLSLAGNANLDLKLGSVQYLSAQANYNWNCCGLSVEYLKYELGSVRNEGAYKFNFTLANIGTAGNIRKTERLF